MGKRFADCFGVFFSKKIVTVRPSQVPHFNRRCVRNRHLKLIGNHNRQFRQQKARKSREPSVPCSSPSVSGGPVSQAALRCKSKEELYKQTQHAAVERDCPVLNEFIEMLDELEGEVEESSRQVVLQTIPLIILGLGLSKEEATQPTIQATDMAELQKICHTLLFNSVSTKVPLTRRKLNSALSGNGYVLGLTPARRLPMLVRVESREKLRSFEFHNKYLQPYLAFLRAHLSAFDKTPFDPEDDCSHGSKSFPHFSEGYDIRNLPLSLTTKTHGSLFFINYKDNGILQKELTKSRRKFSKILWRGT